METIQYITVKNKLSTEDVTRMIYAGQEQEMIQHLKEYDRQQNALKTGEYKLGRVAVKSNKNEGMFISHPSFCTRKGMNFNKLFLPAIQAIVCDDDLRDKVREYLTAGVEVNKHYKAQ